MVKNILQAREQRSLDRLMLQSQGLVGISLSLNIAGAPKSSALINKAFLHLQQDLEVFLTANRIILAPPTRLDTDAAGDFFLSGVAFSQSNATTIKSITERFENTHFLARLIDVDVMDTTGQMVSSHKQKKCLLCDKPAKVCAHAQTHPLETLRSFSTSKLAEYVVQKDTKAWHKKIAQAATQALLYELALSPKPGLVHKNGSGAHKDMNFLTFANSIAALSPYWEDLCSLSVQSNTNIAEETERIRQLGITMEQAMHTSTKGINTHKGAIFALGYLVYLSAKQRGKANLDSQQLQKQIRLYHKTSMQDSLLNKPTPTTHGQETYKTYGAAEGGGARYQMTQGLPIVFDTALPYLEHLDQKRQLFSTEQQAEHILKKVLLCIMAKNADSNILHRSDLQTLKKLQAHASKALKKDELFDTAYAKICHFCHQRNISPGGSADMLAATIFVYALKYF